MTVSSFRSKYGRLLSRLTSKGVVLTGLADDEEVPASWVAAAEALLQEEAAIEEREAAAREQSPAPPFM